MSLWPKDLFGSHDPTLGYTGVAVFFSIVRTVMRQEWRSVLELLFGTSMSMVCAVFTGFFLNQSKYPPATCFIGVAVAALLSHDAIRVLLNFGASAATDQTYGSRLLGAFLPKAPKLPDPEG